MEQSGSPSRSRDARTRPRAGPPTTSRAGRRPRCGARGVRSAARRGQRPRPTADRILALIYPACRASSRSPSRCAALSAERIALRPQSRYAAVARSRATRPRRRDLIQTGPDGAPTYTLDAQEVQQQPQAGVIDTQQVVSAVSRIPRGISWTARADHGQLEDRSSGIVTLEVTCTFRASCRAPSIRPRSPPSAPPSIPTRRSSTPATR